MKIKIKGQVLAETAKNAAHGISTRNIKPILSSVLMSAADGTLLIEATDLEIGVVAQCPCEVLEPGRVCIPGNFVQLLDGLEEKDVEIESEGPKAKLHGQGFNFELSTQDPGQFPSYKPDVARVQAVVNGTWLSKSIRLSKLDIRREDNDFGAINGFCLDFDGQKVNAISTNRVILTATNSECISDPVQAVISHRTTAAIMGVCGDEQIKVGVSPSTISFESGGQVVWSRLVEGRYPPWRKAISPQAEVVAKVRSGDLYQAIKRACYFVSEETIQVQIEFGDQIVVSNSGVKGGGRFEVPGQVEAHGQFVASAPALRAVLSVHQADEQLTLSMTKNANKSLAIDFEGGRHMVAGIN